jgi:4-amino-4-deoxy-L-arabinose transferase-like glycosyltransferase
LSTEIFSSLFDSITGIKKRNFLLALFLLAFLIRALFISIHQDFSLLNEMGGYVYAADNLIAGNGLLFSHERDYRALLPPLYSLFLASIFVIFGKNFLIVRLIQALLGALSVLMTYSIGKKMTNEKNVRIAAIIMVFYPQNVVFSDLILTEVLFLFLFLASFLLLFKSLEKRSYLYASLAGILFGLTSLTRSISFFFLFFLCGVCLISKKLRINLKYIIVTTLLMTLTILPWTIRNYKVKNALILINSKTAIDFYMYNHSDFYHILKNQPNIEDEKKMDALGTDEVVIYKNASMLAHQWIMKHPFLFLFKGIRMMWNLGSLERTFFTHLKGNYYGDLSILVKILITPYLILPFILLMPLIILGIIFIPKNNTPVLISLSLVYYLMILGFVANIFYRQRYPLLPFFTVFGAFGLIHLKDFLPKFFPNWHSGNGEKSIFGKIHKFLPSIKRSNWKIKLTLFLIGFFVFGWVLDIFLSIQPIITLIFR